MSRNKTVETEASVENFINSVDSEQKRRDSWVLIAMMQEITSCQPKMWGTSLVGFGSYHYKYASGRKGDWMLVGFSPRKQSLTLYIVSGFAEYDELMAKLGKHRTGKSCLYINKLDDVDMSILRELVRQSVEHVAAQNQ